MYNALEGDHFCMQFISLASIQEASLTEVGQHVGHAGRPEVVGREQGVAVCVPCVDTQQQVHVFMS